MLNFLCHYLLIYFVCFFAVFFVKVYLFAEALAEGAVKMGMPSALAHSIASQTVLVSRTKSALLFSKNALD